MIFTGKLPFANKTYIKLLYELENALKTNTLHNTIRVLIKQCVNNDELDCLVYLVTRLYPEHKETLDKFLILK